jgi:hypothetical protein
MSQEVGFVQGLDGQAETHFRSIVIGMSNCAEQSKFHTSRATERHSIRPAYVSKKQNRHVIESAYNVSTDMKI